MQPLSLIDMRAEMLGRKVSPVDVVRSCLASIDEQNGTLNAMVFVDRENALASARDSEQRIIDGQARPLEGIPLAIKDDTSVQGMPTSNGTNMVPSAVASQDAHFVAKLREAGAVLVGKTNLPEFATIAVTEGGRWGTARNPLDTSRTPGGSSGGSAVAVAAGFVPAAHGSDGGGSLRIPASCCGLFTVKPTRGRVSTAPNASESPLGVHGFLTRTVADNALLLDIAQGNVAGDAHVAVPPDRPYLDEVRAAQTGGARRLRIAWTAKPPFDVPVDAPAVEAVSRTASLCASLGHEVEHASPDWSDERAQDDFMTIFATPFSSFIAHLVRSGGNLDTVDNHNRALFELGQSISGPDYVSAWARLRQVVQRMLVTWESFDVVLTPTLAQLPPKIGALYQDRGDPLTGMYEAFRFTPFTPIVNVSGQPAASIPLFEYDGLPVGIQAIGRPGDETTLFRLAAELEQAIGAA